MLPDCCERVWQDPAIYRIRLPFYNLGEGESNCFVVHDEDEWLIVDAGAPSPTVRLRLLKSWAALGVDFSRCTAFMTHLHFDHAGSLDATVPRSVTVNMSKTGFLLRKPDGERESHSLFLRRMLACGASFEDACSYAAGNTEVAAIDPYAGSYRFVREGHALWVGRYKFHVVETPGHTPDHLALYHEQSGILFSGDHVLFDVAPAIDALPGVADGLGVYLESLRKVAAMPVNVAFSGHGDAVKEGFAERAREIAAKKLRRCERVLAAVKERPGATAETLARCTLARKSFAQWRSLAPLSRYYYVLDAFVCLQHLYCEGRVVRELGDDGAWRYRACS